MSRNAVTNFPHTADLLRSSPFDHTPAARQLFVDSFREVATHHYDHNRLFRALCDDARFSPESVRIEEDLTRVPPVLVTLFKEHDLLSVDTSEVVLTLTSSGPGGQKSQQHLDQHSLDNVRSLARSVHAALGLTSQQSYDYLCFTYDPRVARDLGTAFTDELLTSFTGVGEIYYAIQWDDDAGEFRFNEPGALETLQRFATSPRPTRILGFPAFLMRLLRDPAVTIDLGPDSWVQTGGGWKKDETSRIDKTTFRRQVADRLAIPASHIRDMFGMVEHGIPYVDCELGQLHVPNYARVLVRSPHDLSRRPDGEVGLLHLLCTYNTSYPCLSVLTTDYGRLQRCSCSIGGPTLLLEGRAGVAKHKGCALTAAEML